MVPSDPGTLALLLLAVGMGAVAAVVLHSNPRLAAVLWAVVICFVPVWFGVEVKLYFAPAVLVGFLIVVALPPVHGTLMKVDLLFGAAVVMALLPIVVGGGSSFATFPMITETLLGYLTARVLAARVGVSWVLSCLTVALTVAAGLAVAEFVLHWNPWVLLDTHNSLYAAWGTLQERGDIVRAEGAFGHSIALGCSLAMAVPFALTRPWPVGVRLLVALVLLLGVVVTFSRAAMLCTALGLVLTILFVQRGLPTRLRVTIVMAVGVVLVLVAPRISTVFADAGSEASGSAEYRGQLLSILPDMAAVGVSPHFHESADGTRRIDGFLSIDNALLLYGLRYGWISLALVLIGLLIAVIAVLSGRGTPPTVALVAQLPALVSVALITQYGILVAFVAGLAVASYDRPLSGDGTSPSRLGRSDRVSASSSAVERSDA